MKNTRLKKAKPSSLKARSRTPRSPAKSASSSTAPTEQQIDKTLEKAELVAGGEVSRQTVLIRKKNKPMIPPMPKRQYIPQPTDTPEVCAKQPRSGCAIVKRVPHVTKAPAPLVAKAKPTTPEPEIQFGRRHPTTVEFLIFCYIETSQYHSGPPWAPGIGPTGCKIDFRGKRAPRAFEIWRQCHRNGG